MSLFKLTQNVTVLPANEQRALIPAAQAGDASAVRALVDSNVRLAANVAKKHVRAGIDIEDLMSVATAAILDAIRKFDASKRAKFSTVARQWMVARCQEVVRAHAAVAGDTRLSRALFCKLPSIKRELAANGQQVNVSNIAIALNAKESDVSDALAIVNNNTVSMSKPVHGDDSAATFGDTLTSNFPSQYKELQAKRLRLALAQFVDALSTRDAHIVRDRILAEFLGNDKTGQQEIANELGISKQRVGQIERKLAGSLKEFLANRGVTP